MQVSSQSVVALRCGSALAVACVVASYGVGCFATHDGDGSTGANNTDATAQGSNQGKTPDGKTPASKTPDVNGGATNPNGDPPADPSLKTVCTRGGLCEKVTTDDHDKLDLLFMIDNSDSMNEEQSKLRGQFPRLITSLVTGQIAFPPTRFWPVRDIHLGVVTSDMGLPGVDGIANCMRLGQDGLMQNQPAVSVDGCQGMYPRFLTFDASTGNEMRVAKDLQCVAMVGTGGCGYEHPLEAPLKALWPSRDAVAVNGQNRILFLPDPMTGAGQLGHGDNENAGFLRNNPLEGLSLIAIVVLTDEDDCSSADTRPFTPPTYLDPNDPLQAEGMNVRCHLNQQALYPVDRYINGFQALRPGNENMVFFAAIAGVPADLADANLVRNHWGSDGDRNAIYDAILKDPRMQEVVDSKGTPDVSDDKLQHSCNGANGGTADPPIRLVQVARGFGANGIVQSICQEDYGPALDAIALRIATQLGARCSSLQLSRDKQGLTACDVLWQLPPPGVEPSNTPTRCGAPGYGFLLPPGKGRAATANDGGAICRVPQLAVVTDAQAGLLAPTPTAADGTTFSDGWYYDDFSEEVGRCPDGQTNRISFSAGAKPPPGVSIVLDCAR